MSYYFSEQHELFRQSLRDFLDKEVRPNINKWEKNRKTPKSIWKKMGDMGFLGLSYPDKYGGANLDFFYEVVFNEELGRINSGGFVITQQVVQYMSGPYILKYGSERLKEKYLPGIISGDLICSIGITEPGAGSDAQNIQTKAIRKEQFYVVNGSKTFITNAIYGDFVVAVVKTNPEKGVDGVSLLIIDLNSKGITKNKLNKLGWHSSDTAELNFDNVEVPVDNLIGEEGMGFKYLMNGLQLERVCFIPSSVTAMEYAIGESLDYMSQRKAFGKSIDQFQVLRHRIAQLSSEVEALKAFGYYCCELYSKGIYDVKLCSMAKLICTELHEKIATQCLQFFGGYGYMEDYPLARMYRDVRVGTIGAGSSEIMREIIAKMMIDDIEYKEASTNYKVKSVDDSSASYFNENHILFRNSLRAFMQKEVVPHVDKWEKEGEIPKKMFKKFASMGYFGLGIDKKYGGSNADIWYTVILHEEMARINCGGFAAAMGAHFFLALVHINSEGNESQKFKYLTKGITGDLIGCMAVTEPFGGSDVKSIRTTAVINGKNYIVNGSKTFITNGVSSDYIVAAVKTKPKLGAKGLSMLVIERNSLGIMATKLDKLGWKASETGEISFNNVKVPAENLLGDENKGFYYIMEHFVSERLSMAVASSSAAQFALDTTIKYLKEREAFGQKISKFQVLRHRVAQMAAEIELNKQFTYSLYNKFQDGMYLVKEASMAKLLATQLCDKVTFQCLQMFGGYGYMEDYPLARMWRDSRLGQIGGGTSEVLCEIISKSIIDKRDYKIRESKKMK